MKIGLSAVFYLLKNNSYVDAVALPRKSKSASKTVKEEKMENLHKVLIRLERYPYRGEEACIRVSFG
jgi:hypothetical protein